ncbi:phospholipid-translocating p-type flippase family protein, putative [Ichthyophthirius multifiliis]|uniref:Phospholipid-transporting ATPase n=1 Tax=Ichthyophthirius multifiliis TaxID=5932 RepID=G0R5H5_ICHMU|nr:phospholipid-translocating p-type flippase family protein, putative [Ichthyophthirius multifiliis]EGR27281.1 phospholipid-translocating p-type flippase family protein, putative [Ichthyophthirius multifiliis]|eukprot:XP_004024165.1 phospholipid-translocating p-type flippase family protein, putative [Ichthyophthirius multifiliis]
MFFLYYYKKIQIQQLKWYQKLYQYFFGIKISQEHRIINIDGTVSPPNYFKNIIKNQKYTTITLIPIVLYNEFKYFFNLFFLLIAISQFIPVLKVGLLFSYVAPLSLVLFLTILKEAYDDYKRFKRDKEANSQEYMVIQKEGQLISLKSSELKVGHIVQVQANQRIPADMILLSTNDISGDVFIKTDQLDGETDWKLRKPVFKSQSLFHQKGIQGIFESKGEFQIGAPIENIYKFQGLYICKEQNQNLRECLSLENSLWSNTVLASGKIWGIVIYTGKETRVALNSRSAVCKFGQLDNELNYLSKLLFVFMLVLSIILVFLKGIITEFSTIVIIFRYVLLLSSIIPISMRVNLDFAKLIYCYKINVDNQIPGTVSRSSQIPEELGRIKFLLTDKTGTLTQNYMIFKKLSLEQGVFTSEEISFISNVVKEQCEKQQKKKLINNQLYFFYRLGPMWDIQQLYNNQQNDQQFNINNNKVGKIKNIRRDKDAILRDLITALAVCHNVIPIYEDGKDKNYQASSPDEVALVKIAESMGVSLDKRTQELITLKNGNGDYENYKVLANFPFSSESKRMGIVVKQIETNRYIFYLKGADTIMKSKVKIYLNIKEVFYQMNQKIYLVKVQEHQLYVKSTQLKKNLINGIYNMKKLVNVQLTEMRKYKKYQFKQKRIWNFWVQQVQKINYKKIFVIHLNLQEMLEQKYGCLLETKCSPTQKSEIVKCIKKYTRQKTAAIGDGGNDVAMIQSADVGIGIVGKEGMQAALAADFSIFQFKYLNRLLLWHGRQSYKRSSVLSQFVIHRGLIISVIQAIFIICFFFVPIPIYNGILMLGYSTIFTMFPVFSLIFDEDVDEITAMNYPPLYKSLQKNRELNTKSFLGWIFISIYQGTCIMILSFLIFNDAFISIQTITYSALIILELLNILTSIHKIHIVMIISILCSIGIYSLTLVFLKNYIIISEWDIDFILKLCIIVFVCWLPPFIFQIIKKKIDPNDFEKIMKNKKDNFKINFKIK